MSEKTQLSQLELTTTTQDFFNGFNAFMLNEDRRVFNKLISRTMIYDSIKHIPGDIVECGVFKGTGLYTFLKLKNIFNPNSYKQVIGFDFFNTKDLLSSIPNSQDKEAMSSLFGGREFEHSKSFRDTLYNKILNDGFYSHEFNLIEGDVSLTTKQFSQENPGFKISLLYMDLDLEEPTYNTLVNLWDNITIGGKIIFDEYGYHKWSESKGVDRFIQERNLKILTLDGMCPTAYIQK